MTTTLANTLLVSPRIRAEAPGPWKKSESLEHAYIVSRAVGASAIINSATLDIGLKSLSRLFLGRGAVAVTIAHELVRHQFAEGNPFDNIVVGTLPSVAAERFGQASASLIGSLIRRVIGPIPMQNSGDVGVTSLHELEGSNVIARRSTIPTDSKTNAKWLEEHSREYTGNWIALREGQLLGSDPSRVELTRRLRTQKQLAGAFLVCLKT